MRTTTRPAAAQVGAPPARRPRRGRARFGAQGYAAATIRQIAADAGVDAALVHYFFGTKDKLYAAVMDIPYSPAEVLTPLTEGSLKTAGPRLVRRFVEVWDDPAAQPGLVATIRSASTHPASAQALREFVTREMQPRVARAVGTPDGDLRAILVGSALVGLAMQRYVLRVEPLASADPETVVAWVGPTVQRYLTGAPAGRTTARRSSARR